MIPQEVRIQLNLPILREIGFFYEQVLEVSNYDIFTPDTGELEVYQLIIQDGINYIVLRLIVVIGFLR